MHRELPTLLVTGASGTVGRNFLETAGDRFDIIAVARRPQTRVALPRHPNVRWIQLDIGNETAVRRVTRYLKARGGVDYVLHLAAYYDFEYVDHPEYEWTNVNGTRHILEQAVELGARRFIFASSLAACAFPPPGETVTETTSPDADYPYAVSKKKGEELVRRYADRLPCSIVRLAAVFSDWCEFAPLYVFLSTWLAENWRARVLGGRGESAIPYIHTSDLNRLFLTILHDTTALPSPGVYLAAPDGSTSHRELFQMATRFYFGRVVPAVHIPGPLAWCGVMGRDLLGRLVGRRPFERPWMVHYLDRKLHADASVTRKELGWAPAPRHHVLRRVLFLVEKLKNQPYEWVHRNEMAMHRPPTRPSLVIHDALLTDKEQLTGEITSLMRSPGKAALFPHYQKMTEDELRWFVRIIYELIMAAVRTGDRTLLLNYLHELARRRFDKGFPPSEVCQALATINEVLVRGLETRQELAGFHESIHDRLTLTLRLCMDGVQDAYEGLAAEALSRSAAADGHTGRSSGTIDLDRIVEELNSMYTDAGDESADPSLQESEKEI